jgi:hypothetical protein
MRVKSAEYLRDKQNIAILRSRRSTQANSAMAGTDKHHSLGSSTEDKRNGRKIVD